MFDNEKSRMWENAKWRPSDHPLYHYEEDEESFSSLKQDVMNWHGAINDSLGNSHPQLHTEPQSDTRHDIASPYNDRNPKKQRSCN